MIHVLLDTNIPLNMLLDPLKRSMPVESGMVMDALEKRKFTGYITPTTYSNLFFLIKRDKGRKEASQFALALFDLVKIVEQTEAVLRDAILSGWPDAEDAGQYFAAKHKAGITHLCTTNGKHFKKAAGIKVVSPAGLLALI